MAYTEVNRNQRLDVVIVLSIPIQATSQLSDSMEGYIRCLTLMPF